jgi:hypothetical protein
VPPPPLFFSLPDLYMMNTRKIEMSRWKLRFEITGEAASRPSIHISNAFSPTV